MTVESQTSSGSFFQLVLLPKIRIGLILLAVLAIGFGSWLETNESVSSCSFKSSLAMHQVFLYRNISSNLTTPDSVTFGLWRHCYIYALNCSCSPVDIKYQPDFSTILQTATEHNAVAPISNLTSLSRIIPLLMATVLSVVALFLSGIANKLRQYLYRRIVSGIVLVTIILLAYAFGSTYSNYSKTSWSVCRDPDNPDILCSSYGIQGEVIVFSIGLALLFLGFLFWILITFSRNESEMEDASNKRQSKEWTQVTHIAKKNDKKKPTTSYPPENEQYYSAPPQDELAVWRDVTLFDKNLEWEQDYQEKEDMHYYNQQQQQQQQQKPQQSKLYSKYNLQDHTSLSPPPQAKRNHQTHGNRQRATEYNNHHRNYTSTAKEYYNQRRASRDSALVLGGPQKPKQHSQQSRHYYEHERNHKNKTPTSISPHPFMYTEGRRGSNTNNMGYTHDNESSASNSSSGYYQNGQQSYTDIPMLQMPPTKGFSQHPLSKKKIKDKRIQSYLQSS